MAQAGAWESIRRHGLLSTTALLDLFEVPAAERNSIESTCRRESMAIRHPAHGYVIIRDNKPLPESKLSACLTDMTPEQWYRYLNRKVFFWPTRERVLGLTRARAYRCQSHTIITVDARTLITASCHAIHLSRINSGAAIYAPTPRGSRTFVPLLDWPSAVGPRSGKLKSAVAEVAVDYAVPNIITYAIQVEEMRDGEPPRIIWAN